MYRVIKPLNANYRRISVRATQLENIISPFPSFIKEEYRLKAFKDWKNLWSFIQSYLLKPDLIDEYLNLYNELWIEFPRINNIKDITYKLYSYSDDRLALKDIVMIQPEFEISYEIWDYLVDFWWTLDCICMSDSWYFISDIKTASQKWKKWYEHNRYQCIFYTALLSEAMWIYEWSLQFQYWVFNKKNWSLDIRTRDISREWAVRDLEKFLLHYTEQWRLDSLHQRSY